MVNSPGGGKDNKSVFFTLINILLLQYFDTTREGKFDCKVRDNGSS
jgi:hypothetical protein